MKNIALFALVLLAFTPTARAQDEARVAILKAQIEGFLEQQKSVALKNGSKLDTKGNVTVEKAAGYYAFTLPSITYIDAKSVRTEIGMIALNAVPQANNEWKVTMALPTPIKSYGSGGGEQFRTDIGTQTSNGIWNERLGHFTSVDSNYGNIQFNNLIDQSTYTIGSLSINSQITEKDPDAFTGTAIATLDNISIFDAGTTFKGVIPKITLNTNLADQASKTPMTKEQVKNRQVSAYPDAYNMIAFMFGAPERVQAKITGLDSLNAQAQQAMIMATPTARAKLLQVIMGISAISSMGRPVPEDAQSKSYDVVFGKSGNISVNGTDLGSLVQSTTAQPAAGIMR